MYITYIYIYIYVSGASDTCMNIYGASNICMNICGAPDIWMNIYGAHVFTKLRPKALPSSNGKPLPLISVYFSVYIHTYVYDQFITERNEACLERSDEVGDCKLHMTKTETRT